MTNLQRLQLEIQGITLTQDQMQVYLAENGLKHVDDYKAESQASKRAIYKTALSILESIANNPALMKNYKQDDMSVADFAQNLQNRIDQLERKIRMMQNDDSKSDSNFFVLFNS